MNDLINAAYAKPDKKFCYYTGNNHPEIAKHLGLKTWDWTPRETYFHNGIFGLTHTIPLALGCKKIYTSGGKEWVEPLIETPDDIDKVKIPDVSQRRTGEILDLTKKLMKQYPEEVAIRFPDIQSPLGVAELMWGDSFYESLLLYPDEIHELLKKISSFTISYVKELQNIMGGRANPCCFPHIFASPGGYYIADDTNSMVSAEMHLEYSVEYINRITDEVGPVYYHSCTWLQIYFENIKKIKNAMAKNWSIIVSDDPAEILKEFSGHVLLTPHIHQNMHTEDNVKKLGIKSEYEMVKYILDNMQENTTLYLHFYDDLMTDVKKMVNIYKLLDTYGYTPQANGL